MNILILGNGFDIAHGLPTKYQNFLSFIKELGIAKGFEDTAVEYKPLLESRLEEPLRGYVYKLVNDADFPRKHVKTIYEERKHDCLDEMLEQSDENFWIAWFATRDTYVKENWIDFESEISRVVQLLDREYQDLLSSGNRYRNSNPMSATSAIFQALFQVCGRKLLRNWPDVRNTDYAEIKKRLLNDLNRLIRALELYLEEAVRSLPNTKLSPDIDEICIDKVLSFNYTDTYKRWYDTTRHVEYDYIHGKSKLEKTPENNMVLGIDEYLSVGKRDCNTEFVQFKKFFQRIRKGTGNRYKTWLEAIRSNTKENHRIYIFGHSLDVTDKDVLLEILLLENVDVTIFYYDNSQLEQHISNLVKVLTEERLITMTAGTSPHIRFVKQQDMQDRDAAGWQVKRDIQALYNAHNLSQNKYEEIQARINTAVAQSDAMYFHTQENVVSVYDALQSLDNVSDEIRQRLLEICEALFIPDGEAFLDKEKWYDYNELEGIVPCAPNVESFIEAVNEKNQDKRTLTDILQLRMDCVSELYVQLKQYVLGAELKIEVLNRLFAMLDEPDVLARDVDKIWQCLFRIQGEMSESEYENYLAAQEKKTEKMGSVHRFRLRHLREEVETEQYLREQQQQASEGLMQEESEDI